MDGGDIPSDDALFDAMEQMNPWWRGGRVPDELLRSFKRRGHDELLRRMDDHPAHALFGARQVGKTTVLYQLADTLASRADPRRIMFAALDEGALFPSAGNLRRMLDLYAGRVLRERLHRTAQRTYVILDEIQAVKGWQTVVKNMVDRRGPMTFVVSGSAGVDAPCGSAPLLGRMRLQSMPPMSFSEYASFRGRQYAPRLRRIGEGMRGALAEAVRERDAGRLCRAAESALEDIALFRGDILLDISDYMTYGGCPGVVSAESHSEKAETVKAGLRLSMSHDIAGIGGVRNPQVLQQLFVVLAQGSPRLVNKDRTARTLGITRATLDSYLDLLAAAHLVSYSSAYAPGPPARSRREKKAYVNDAGMRNVASARFHAYTLSDAPDVGLLAASVAGDHTRRLWAELEPAALPDMPYYWRSGRGDEVDLLIELQGKLVPIEVKYRKRVETSDLRGLSRFADSFGRGVAIAVTQDQAGPVGDHAAALPLWLYLAMCA